MLQLRNLSVKINKKLILWKINYKFELGKTYAIMGPNGSGKSTLAYAIAGHPDYQIESGQIKFKGKDIGGLSPEKRAKVGIFLSFQSPMSLSGVSVFQLLKLATGKKKDPLLLKRQIELTASKLKINQDLISRSLNEGASGGEKKKLELLQAAILDPSFLIFDEIDTGVDVDSLKTIAGFLKTGKAEKTYVLITHYNRILSYLKPDKVLIMYKGKLVKTGNAKLADEIEKNGYNNTINRRLTS